MKTILIPITFTSLLMANSVNTDIETYYEHLEFKNSLQKNSSNIFGVGGTLKLDNSTYKLFYEKAKTDTKQPPLKDDLKIEKLYAKYNYKINDKWGVNLNYLNVVDDNIAPTAHGQAYGIGATFNITKPLSVNFTQFYTNYDKFNVYQSDLNFNYIFKQDNFKIKLTTLTKLIHLDNKDSNSFSKNAKESYLTQGIKLHSHYKSYHFGMGAYFGKRAFAIMQNGFKIQHHAMEFDRTYAIGFGKTFSNFVLRTQYAYHRATELPMNNEHVTVRNLKVIATYKF